MYHDTALVRAARSGDVPDPRPPSAVSGGAGAAGLAGLLAWLLVARAGRLDGPYSALVGIGLCGLTMVGWSLLVDRVHRHASTGIDWSHPRPLAETWKGSATKLVGYWATWAGIGSIYCVGRFYWAGGFGFAMWCLAHAAPLMVLLSVPYVLWLDRYLIERRDDAWHLGAWLTRRGGADRRRIHAHLLSWGVKAFFLPFMLGGVPTGFGLFVRGDLVASAASPVGLAQLMIGFMFLVDMSVATVGYMLTFRPLDAQIRSANPYAAAWMPALICYPPFILMSEGGPLDYHPGTADWAWWLSGHPVAQILVGATLVALTGVYAWATLAFGPRFSNLTNRGILTHGPYRWTRHPAYLSKNLFWWLATLPWLTTGTIVDAVRATLLLAAVSGVYFWRAKTEERHLRHDLAYVAYSDWVDRNGPVPRFFAWLRAHDALAGGQKLASAYTRDTSPSQAP